VTPFAGALLATGSGSLVAEEKKEGHYYLDWFSNQDFLFDPPSAYNLAVLANTAWTAETGDRYARTYYAPPRARYVFLNRKNACYVRQVTPTGVTPAPTLFLKITLTTLILARPQMISRVPRKQPFN
jgi:hypothetical protein